MGLTITFNRGDGTERAKFDNLEDGLLFVKALKKEINEGRVIDLTKDD